jgi:hypothetical protein
VPNLGQATTKFLYRDKSILPTSVRNQPAIRSSFGTKMPNLMQEIKKRAVAFGTGITLLLHGIDCGMIHLWATVTIHR